MGYADGMTPYFERDGCVIYHGDARELLPLMPAVDLVLTDPPYGIGEARKVHKRATDGARRGGFGNVLPTFFPPSEWDDEPPSSETIRAVIAAGRHAILWGGNYFNVPPSSKWLVWDKDNAETDFADCELAWTNLRGAVRRKRFRWNGALQEYGGKDKEIRVHPTQKPVPVMRWCIEQAGDVASILDPFLGSGTTLLAARDLGIRATGIEREERYCEIAARRLAQGVFAFTT